jgi:oxygen-independent coproporphyrinogen III oxidase
VTEEGDSADRGYVLRSTNTDDLTAYLAGENQPETAWLSPVSQHEEAWFLGLRLNAGVEVEELEREFGVKTVAAALHVVRELEKDELLTSGNGRVQLTPRGRLLSNEVFQQFLGLAPEETLTTPKPG